MSSQVYIVHLLGVFLCVCVQVYLSGGHCLHLQCKVDLSLPICTYMVLITRLMPGLELFVK